MIKKIYQLKNHNTKNEKIKLYATIELKKEKLKLDYEIIGDISLYIFPKQTQQQRANELWKATCFELFMNNYSSTKYYEINISPSTQWNSYQFTSYKKEMIESHIFSTPTIRSQQQNNGYNLSFEMDFTESIFEKKLLINCAVILLDNKGVRYFYSINRRKELPDFHDREYFELLL